MTTDYSDIDALSAVYLEDSYVLDIVEQPGELRFRLEAVLTEAHPSYQPPKPGEQYCYANAWLVFTDVTRIEWDRRSNRRFTDESDEEDLGNIDQLERRSDHWLVSGDWGEVHVYTQAEPRLILSEP